MSKRRDGAVSQIVTIHTHSLRTHKGGRRGEGGGRRGGVRRGRALPNTHHTTAVVVSTEQQCAITTSSGGKGKANYAATLLSTQCGGRGERGGRARSVDTPH
uniref:Uncharacterized protein n=1 Tax=Palpitomonas bilix TaxID=652834 RepID=A0A7S3GFE0_9EUKA